MTAPKRIIACAAAGLTAATVLAGCDSAPPVHANARQVTVVGSGQVQGVPDTLTADVAIEVVAPDVTAAMNQAGDRQQAVIGALTSGGIDTADISTTGVSLQPQYGDNSQVPGMAAITGYRASNSIRVRIRKLDSASGALARDRQRGRQQHPDQLGQLFDRGRLQLVGDARARAFNDARNRAEQYAQLSGLSLGKVISISESPGGGRRRHRRCRGRWPPRCRCSRASRRSASR